MEIFVRSYTSSICLEYINNFRNFMFLDGSTTDDRFNSEIIRCLTTWKIKSWNVNVQTFVTQINLMYQTWIPKGWLILSFIIHPKKKRSLFFWTKNSLITDKSTSKEIISISDTHIIWIFCYNKLCKYWFGHYIFTRWHFCFPKHKFLKTIEGSKQKLFKYKLILHEYKNIPVPN